MLPGLGPGTFSLIKKCYDTLSPTKGASHP